MTPPLRVSLVVTRPHPRADQAAEFEVEDPTPAQLREAADALERMTE